jgi:hypothetical protein
MMTEAMGACVACSYAAGWRWRLCGMVWWSTVIRHGVVVDRDPAWCGVAWCGVAVDRVPIGYRLQVTCNSTVRYGQTCSFIVAVRHKTQYNRAV